MKTTLALLWIHFGPYHAARSGALTRAFHVENIEFAGLQRIYGWQRRAPSLAVHTLSADDWESSSQSKIGLAVWTRLGSLEPDVVLVPGYSCVPALVAAMWGKVHRKRVILMTESTRGDRQRRSFVEALKRLTIPYLFDAVIAGGQRAASYARSLGCAAERIGHGYDVVDNSFFADGADDLRRRAISSDFDLPERYFLFVGRLAPEKNLERLLEAFALYRSEGGDRFLVLAGHGPLRGELEAQAKRLSVGNWVRFAGFREDHDLIPYYSFADFLILPSVVEPWGLVVNEAMAAGLPVIVSKNCGCVDDLVIDGKTGFVVDALHVMDLASMMLRAGAMPREESRAMGARARAHIGHYSLEHWASEVERLAKVS